MLHKLAFSIVICVMMFGFKKASGQGLNDAKKLVVGSWKTAYADYILYWNVKGNNTYTYKITVAGAETLAEVKGTYELSETTGRGAFSTGNSSTMGSTAILMSLTPKTPRLLKDADRRKLESVKFRGQR